MANDRTFTAPMSQYLAQLQHAEKFAQAVLDEARVKGYEFIEDMVIVNDPEEDVTCQK